MALGFNSRFSSNTPNSHTSANGNHRQEAGAETAGTVAFNGVETAGTVAFGGVETAGTVAFGGVETAGTVAFSGVETAGTVASFSGDCGASFSGGDCGCSFSLSC